MPEIEKGAGRTTSPPPLPQRHQKEKNRDQRRKKHQTNVDTGIEGMNASGGGDMPKKGHTGQGAPASDSNKPPPVDQVTK